MDMEKWMLVEGYGDKKEASNYYGINYSTLCCWLNGTNPMPKEWKKKGLSYYGK